MSRRSAVKAEPRVTAQSPQERLGVGYLLGRARGSLLTGLDAELERFGLNGMQFGVLKHLAEGAAHTAADLCRRMHYDTGSMTRILDRLEAKGLVRRERGREDRRLVLLRLAPGGRVLLPRLLAVAARVLEGHLAGFSAAEIEALKNYLGRMIDNGQARGDNEHSPTGARS
ncbi:MAG: MarR family transcriptional regulator [Gammaproteobacteria bacterium]|nr:MAG: MarR family transcriptional regulator [Gammaproteobacteria bacterium]TLY85482.1 MAG: MarR family transcriptional regulator [Gammaproteobacteria bacterium]